MARETGAEKVQIIADKVAANPSLYRTDLFSYEPMVLRGQLTRVTVRAKIKGSPVREKGPKNLADKG